MDTPLPGIGHNMLADAERADLLPTLLHDAQELVKVVDAWRAKVPTIDNEERAVAARDLLAKLLEREKKVEEARKEEKEPFLEAGRAVDAKWAEPKALLAACIPPVKTLLDGWLKRERVRQQAEAAKAAAEAAEAKRKADEAAHAAAKAKTTALEIDAQRAAKRAQAAIDAAQQAARAKPQVQSTVGARALSVRRTFSARLTNFPLACRHYANRPELLELLERLASADARAAKGNITLPGFEIVESEGVA